MNNSNVSETGVSNYNTQIILDDGSWSNGIRSIFLYSTAAWRISMTRPSPGRQFAIVGMSIFGDFSARFISNAINNPRFILEHYRNWKIIRNGDSVTVTVNPNTPIAEAIDTLGAQVAQVPTGQVTAQSQAAWSNGQAYAQAHASHAAHASQNGQVTAQAQAAWNNAHAAQAGQGHGEVIQAIQAAQSNKGGGSVFKNNFISDGNGLEDIQNNMINKVMVYIKPILQPVQVDYSNELLANQIYGISIMLFILSLVVIGLLVFFIFNVIIFAYSDKIMNYFNNKYIRWYIALNKKFIVVEIFLLSVNILYSMYYLSYGIHFIATHPITFS